MIITRAFERTTKYGVELRGDWIDDSAFAKVPPTIRYDAKGTLAAPFLLSRGDFQRLGYPDSVVVTVEVAS